MNDKIKHLLATADKTDSIAKNKWRIENREQLREQRKRELKELMEKDNEMSNNKQSSIELFIEQLEEKGGAWENVSIRKLNISIDVSDYMELKQQAKAMHKTEHGKTWDDAMENMKARGGNDMRAYTDFDDYYAETYGGNK